MPRQFKTYTRFDGGLNTKTNARSIKDNELADIKNAIVDEFGQIKSCGFITDNTSDYTAPAVDAIQPGYGLFQATFDYNEDSDNTPVVRTFLADTDATSDTRIDVADANGSFVERVDLGTDDDGKVIYHVADGAVRICDTNTANTGNAIKYYGMVKGSGRWLDSDGARQTVGGHTGANVWNTFDVKLSPPTSGVVSLSTFKTALAAGGSTTSLVSSVSTAFSDMDTELDKGTYYAVNDTDSTVDLISSRTNDTTLVTASSGAVFGTGGELYSIYPPSGTGFNLDVTVTGSAGTWSAGTYEFASTFIYDEIQESLLYNMSGTVVITANDKLTCTVLGTEFVSSVNYNYRITGARFYTRISGSDDEWVLLGEAHLRFGSRPSLSGDYTYWVMLSMTSTNYYAYTQFVSLSKNVDTYESINGFSHDTPYISIGADGENYQTSVVTNRRAFIAGVNRYESTGILVNKEDTIMYSEINKFDTFPTFNFIDIGINDGDKFIKIESFADRLLAFKEKSLYVINIGSGSDTQWFLESEHKNMGVLFHAAVVKIDIGVVWANKNGLFLYDGSLIRNLQTKILESTWKAFINNDTMVGFEPVNKHLVVIRDAAASGGTSGDAYIYSFTTNSFTFIEDLADNAIKTNIITDAYNQMTLGIGTDELESYDGEPDTGSTFDITLKDDDFGIPNICKKIYAITIEYSSFNDNTSAINYNFVDHNGTRRAFTTGNISSSTLRDTNGDLDLDRYTFDYPVPFASSFQLRLDMNGNSLQTINNIGIEYRPIYRRIT